MHAPAAPTDPRIRDFTDFLLRHYRCGRGFDVSRSGDSRNGRLSVACLGCGRSFDYRTATIELERELTAEVTIEGAGRFRPASPPRLPESDLFERLRQGPHFSVDPVPGDLGPIDVAKADELWPSAAPQLPEASGPEPAFLRESEEWHRPRRHSPRITALFAVIAIASGIFAAIRVFSDVSSPTGASKPRGSAQAPAGGSRTSTAGSKGATPGNDLGTVAAPSKRPNDARIGPGTPLHSPGYTLTRPADWTQGSRHGAVVLTAPGGRARIEIFAETRPDLSGSEMQDQAASFLARRHAGSSVTAAAPTRLGRTPALRIRARFPGGAEEALVAAHRAWRYLLLSRIEAGAPGRITTQTGQALRSFTPR